MYLEAEQVSQVQYMECSVCEDDARELLLLLWDSDCTGGGTKWVVLYECTLPLIRALEFVALEFKLRSNCERGWNDVRRCLGRLSLSLLAPRILNEAIQAIVGPEA